MSRKQSSGHSRAVRNNSRPRRAFAAAARSAVETMEARLLLSGSVQPETVSGADPAMQSLTATPNPVSAGADITYLLSVANLGTSDAGPTTVSDPLPAGTVLYGTAILNGTGWARSDSVANNTNGTITFSADSFPGGASAEFEIIAQTASSTAAGTAVFSDTATIAGTNDANDTDNSMTATTDVQVDANNSIAIINGVPGLIAAGGNLTYDISTVNTGPSDASNVTITDPLPADTTLVSASIERGIGWSRTDSVAFGDNGTVTFSNPDVPALSPSTFLTSRSLFQVVVHVDSNAPSGAMISNTVTAASSSPDLSPIATSATASTITQIDANNSIAIINGVPGLIPAGGNLTYDISTVNTGPSDASNVTITDPLPADTTLVSASIERGIGWSRTDSVAVGDNGTITFSNPDVPALSPSTFLTSRALFQIVVNVDSNAPAGGTISNTVTAASSSPDSSPISTSATASTTALAPLTGSIVPLGPAVEGSLLGGVVANFNDPNGAANISNDSAVINWGDGHSTIGTIAPNGHGGYAVLASHFYLQPGNFTEQVTLSNGVTPTTFTSPVDISEAPITASNGAHVTTNVGRLVSDPAIATFVDGDPLAPATSYTAEINWGDGVTTTGAISGTFGHFTVAGSHIYTQTGDFTAKVKIVDSGPTAAFASTAITVNPAVVTGQGLVATGQVGRVIIRTLGTFSDTNASVGAGQFTAAISWGDGTTSAGTIIENSPGKFHVAGTHVYSQINLGGYAVKVTIQGPGGSTTIINSLLQIFDPPLDEASDLTLTQSAGVSFTNKNLGTFRDQDSLNTNPGNYTGTIDWGDGQTSTAKFVFNRSTFNVGSYWTVQGSHKYAAKGNYSVTITVRDIDTPGKTLVIPATFDVV